jgi:hypothetical protein
MENIATPKAQEKHSRKKATSPCLFTQGGHLNFLAMSGREERHVHVHRVETAGEDRVRQIYSAHARTRKSAGSMTRKLSVTWSQ